MALGRYQHLNIYDATIQSNLPLTEALVGGKTIATKCICKDGRALNRKLLTMVYESRDLS